MEGSQIFEGGEAAIAVARASLNPFHEFKGEAKTVGEVKVGSEDCYKVDIADLGFVFFSKASGLLVRNETPDGNSNVSDWKVVDGIRIAHKTVIEGEITFEIVINSIEHNVDIADSAFAVPAEIKALLSEE